MSAFDCSHLLSNDDDLSDFSDEEIPYSIVSTLKRRKQRKTSGRLLPNKTMSSASAADQKESDTHITGVCSTFTQHHLNMLIARNKRRTIIVRMKVAAMNRMSALIRGGMGFSTIKDPADPRTQEKFDADMKKIVKKVAALIKTVENGDPSPELSPEIILMVLATLKSIEPLEEYQKNEEALMEQMIELHPLYPFQQATKGFGPLGLAIIIAEAGYPITNYRNPSCLWKRFGLAVMQREDGTMVRQGGIPKGSSAEEWIAHGYKKQRRAQIYAQIQDSLVKHQHKGIGDLKEEADEWMKDNPGELKPLEFMQYIGPYGRVYRTAKEKGLLYVERDKAAGLDLKNKNTWGGKRAEAHARRVMAKALLLDIWLLSIGKQPKHSDYRENA